MNGPKVKQIVSHEKPSDFTNIAGKNMLMLMAGGHQILNRHEMTNPSAASLHGRSCFHHLKHLK